MLNSSNFGHEFSPQFTDIWTKVEDFLADYKESGIYESDTANRLDDDHAKLLYFLLYSRYGNNMIAGTDRNRFKYNVFSIIFQYGPTWVKRLEIQDKLRSLSEEDLITGAKAIYNHAYNPGQAPTTASLTEILAINEQNTTNMKKSKLDGYNLLLGLLDTDVTGEFLDKFKKLFCKFANTVPNLWFVED